MATGKVTKLAVDAMKPGERDVFLWDAGDKSTKGFGVKVTPSGSRVYVFQYRFGGRTAKTKRCTIGKHGKWNPTSAREEAERLGRLVSQGVDPLTDMRERQRVAVDLAFKGYGERFLRDYVRGEWKASYVFAESILRLHVFPVLGAKPLPSITRSDLSDLLDRIPSTQAALRRNVFAVVRRLFRWAVGRGDIERSPLEGFEAPSNVASRDRTLDDDELVCVWRGAEALGYPFGPLFHLLIATGQRREEVAALDWKELDRAAAVWTLPAARAKNGLAHIVPLGPLAMAALDAVATRNRKEEDADKPVVWPRRGFVFTTTGETAVSGYSRAKSRLDTAIAKVRQADALEQGTGLLDAGQLDPWRVHDLRRTLATGMQRLGVRFEVTEAILNHVSGARAGVAGVYQRHDWRDEKRVALEAWDGFVTNLIRGQTATNIINLDANRRRA